MNFREKSSAFLALQRSTRRIYRHEIDPDFRCGIHTISKSSALKNAPDVVFHKRGNRIHINYADFPDYSKQSGNLRYYGGTVIYWLLKCSPTVKSLKMNLSDGDEASDAPFAFSTTSPEIITLPDPHFFESRGYRDLDKVAETQPAWQDRSDDIIWRGVPTGVGHIAFDPDYQDKPVIRQRIRLAHLTNGSDVDVKFVNNPEYQHLIQKNGLSGKYVDQASWGGRKYAIDIDGMVNTWGNFISRLKLGCCVIKIDGALPYRQWYYDRIKAGEHYVSVKADMSDFFEKVDWVRSNPAKAEEIAKNGQEFARKMTFASATQDATKLIEEHWDK